MIAPPPRAGAGAHRRPSPSRSAPLVALPEIDAAANPEKIQGDGEPFSSKLGHDRFGGGAKPDAPTDRINACRLALPSREVVLLLIGFPVLTSFFCIRLGPGVLSHQECLHMMKEWTATAHPSVPTPRKVPGRHTGGAPGAYCSKRHAAMPGT